MTFSFAHDHTNYLVFTNGVQSVSTNYPHAALTDLTQFTLGDLKATYSVTGLWRRNLSSNELVTLDTVVRRHVFTSNTQTILEGDSIISYAVSSQSAWQRYIFGGGSDWSASGKVSDISTAGHSTSDILSDWPAQLRTHTTNTLSTERNLLVLWVGSNDLGNYSDEDRPVATIHANLRALWQSARTNGCYIAAAPVLSRAVNAGRPQSDLEDLNTLIRADEGIYYDYLIDHHAQFLSEYGVNYHTNTALFPDQIHPGSLAAQQVIYRAVQAKAWQIFP